MNKILVPCDFSETSNNALNYAVELAKNLSADLLLLHVTQLPVMNSEFGLTSFAIPNSNEDNQMSLQKLADEIKKNHPTISKISCHAEIGNTTDLITDYSKNHDVTIAVMGISGHGNKLVKAFLGSTAVTVSKSTNTPLIIVPPDASYKKLKNVAYACDYDEHIESNTSLLQVKALASIIGTSLNVLHVIPENHDLNVKESHIDSYVEHSLEAATHKTFIITDNNVSEGLIEFIENHDIDAIIIEPKKHSFFHNLFYPSITNEIAFYSPVPVITIHGS
jgi:nucleotide-binding universal stress UspA family protein